MSPGDFFFAFVLKKLFFDQGGTSSKSPAVVFPPGSAAAPAPAAAPGAAAPAALPAATFPSNVQPPAPQTPPQGTPAPPGFKRAIEVWIVQPALAKQAEQAISGMGQQIGALTLSMLESQFPKGWQAARTATAQEGATAKALLAQWHDGGVVFLGPQTPSGRRAFKMTKHPGSPAPTASAPLPSQAQFPSSAPPAASPAPAARPAPAQAPAPTAASPSIPSGSTLPEVLITADANQPDVTSRNGTPVQQVVTVRKGEGLANIAKRLGKPATGASAVELRNANIPQGPDAKWQPTDLTKGGIKKAGRAGGLQPGDRLFVPPSWGFVDAARL